MTASAGLSLTTNIAAVPTVGERKAEAFRRIGVRCVADLIRHLPMRYEHERQEQTIAAAGEIIGQNHGAEANLAARGQIAGVRTSFGRKKRVEAMLEDPTGTIQLIWFNATWIRHKLHPGMKVLVHGKMKRRGDYLQMVNPKWAEITPDQPPETRQQRYRPVYPATEKLRSTDIERAIDAILEEVPALIEDHLPDDYRTSRSLPPLAEAYWMIHRPGDEDEALAARRRLAFDDLLMQQIGVMLKRRHLRRTMHAPALKLTEAIDQHITARFPFELTPGQRTTTEQIARDLSRQVPMNRLLQGDVGAGKTVVGLYGMLMAVASEHQAALMAPTELLAEQHYLSITRMLEGSNVTIELLTGSLKPTERAAVHDRLASGEIDILIGTHALLTETLHFRSLALAIIDEQHRFGVHQRARLRAKSDHQRVPHVLVMTATPIPRTLSLTLFGDLDVSTIRDLPPGRQPVLTRVVSRGKSDEVYSYVNRRLDAGEQAFVVVPVIDDSQHDLTDVRSHKQWLETGHLRGRRLAAVHGRLDRAERAMIMDRFRRGEIDVLVATTVIEVGVDIPNATMMIIEHAERFGLAQLHQLRGRIGRGDKRGLCVLIADPATDDGRARVDAIAATTDGFKIAEKDLEIRGPGELFGARQAGAAPFHVAELPRDLDLLTLARRDAQQWIEENPTLQGPRDALLKTRLLKAYGDALGLGDVA